MLGGRLGRACVGAFERAAKAVAFSLGGLRPAGRVGKAGAGMDEESTVPGPAPVTLSCSFCGKASTEVGKLVAGSSVAICNECVGLCGELLAAEPRPKPLRALDGLVAALHERLVGHPEQTRGLWQVLEAVSSGLHCTEDAAASDFVVQGVFVEQCLLGAAVGG